MRNRTIKLFSLFAFALLFALPSFQLGSVANSQVTDDKPFGQPSRADRQVSLLVSQMMKLRHLSQRKLDDSISRRAFKMFLRTLDPTKIYFTQSDIQEFEAFQDKIDDGINQGDYTIAFNIFNRFLERMDQRVEDIMKLIDSEFDYSIDEDMITDSDLVDYPKDEEEAIDRWRKRVKYNLMVLKNDKTNKTDPKETLRKRYKAQARRMHQTDNGDLIEMYITAVTSSYDPHTTYMSTETFENFLISLRLQLEGIGATLQASEDDGYTVVKRIVVGGAAHSQGELKVEDKIVAVGQGSDGEMNDVTGMKLDDVVKQIRGKAGTIVRLSVLSGDSGMKTISIVREKIKLEDSAASGAVFEEGQKADGSPFKIGVIDLPSFYADLEGDGSSEFKSTTRDVDRILGDFREQSVDAVVLDLRRNGGGSLREAIDCTGLFINRGPVVQVKGSDGRIEKYDDLTAGMSWGGPLVVLTSKFSASASEILAGAVQDYGRGIVVGDTTSHGKGTVQSLMDLNQMMFGANAPTRIFGALKITQQQFYRPNGDSTQKRGVLADIVLPSISNHMDVGESDLDYPVEFDKISAASYSPMSLTDAELLEKIRQASLARVKSSEKFQESQEKIDAYLEQKARKSVTLNMEKYLARREKFNSEEEEKNEIEEQINHSSLKIERTFYLDEVIQIAVDYTQALNKKIGEQN